MQGQCAWRIGCGDIRVSEVWENTWRSVPVVFEQGDNKRCDCQSDTSRNNVGVLARNDRHLYSAISIMDVGQTGPFCLEALL